MEHKKGYTLIELLVTLALATLVFASCTAFFTAGINNSKRIKINSELQFQAQYILNFFSEKAMSSKRVELILFGSPPVSKINSEEEQTVSKIAFRYGENNYQCHVFQIRGIKIFYTDGRSTVTPTSELGTYVKEVKIKPYPVGKSFAEASGLKITLILAKDDEEYEASQLIHMRLS